MAANITVSSLLARLEKWLLAKRPRFHKGLLPGASATELKQLESALGRNVPSGLKSLLSWHNGQSPDVPGGFIEDWRLMSASRIAELKAQLDADAKSSGWQTAWIPFLEDDAGNVVCLDGGKRTLPVREFWAGNQEHPVLGRSLTAWLEDLVKTIEANGYYEDPERGSFMRTTRS